MVARSDNGQALKAWVKEYILCDPLRAEASAIFWALKLVDEEKFQQIIVEGDSKICFDNLNEVSFNVNWNVSGIIRNISSLNRSFLSCSFNWVRRETNEVAHSLVNYCEYANELLYINHLLCNKSWVL